MCNFTVSWLAQTVSDFRISGPNSEEREGGVLSLQSCNGRMGKRFKIFSQILTVVPRQGESPSF